MTHASQDRVKEPHLRLTPLEVFELWKQGDYTPKGYLYHLILAQRRVGWWWRIDNVTEFCRQWEIPRSTFYRAKAALIAEGKLQENIIGAVELCIPDGSSEADLDSTNVCPAGETGVSLAGIPVPNLGQGVSLAGQSVSDLGQVEPETEAEQTFCDATDLLQPFFNSPPQSVCKDVCSFKQAQDPELLNSEDFSNDRPSVSNQSLEAQENREGKYTPPILQRAEKIGVNLRDRNLQRVIALWPERLPTAIACLEEKRATVKHPTRFLQRAIEDSWQPEKGHTAPTGFGAWFNEARRRSLVVASEMREGVLTVCLKNERWIPFEQLRQRSWDELSAWIGSLNHAF
ncbi:MAG: hypothetical protein F6J97_00855 [Leptolyngbya sp. SIO4C1]|nr:hypothetical protein [Leptolyngbya sp. SIO4C1]